MLYFQYILNLITCHVSCRSRDPKQWHTLWIPKSSFNREVCHWQHFQRICIHRSLIWKSLIALSMLRVLFNKGIPVSAVKNIWRWYQELCMLSIALYQDFLKVIPKAALGSHSHGNMKQSEIFGVTEPTLNVAYVTPHQLKNGTPSIMAWCLPASSFSVDTVLSAQHHQLQVCNKTNTKLST